MLEVVRAARERAGISQRDLARRLGFHPTVLGKIERGERMLDVVEFSRLADAIGADPMELFGEFLRSRDS